MTGIKYISNKAIEYKNIFGCTVYNNYTSLNMTGTMY